MYSIIKKIPNTKEDLYNENGEMLIESDFLDKTIDITGIVDYFSGEYQIKVFTAKDITVH